MPPSGRPVSAPDPPPAAQWVALHLPTLALEAFVAALPLQARGRPVALLEAGRVAAVAESAAVLA